MKKINNKIINITLSLLFLTSPFIAQSSNTTKIEEVKVYNWSNIVKPEIIQGFTNKLNIQLMHDVFDNDLVMNSKLMAGSTGYDLVVPTFAPYLLKHIQVNMYQKLDKNKIEHYKNLDPQIISLMDKHNNASDYSVPLVWGTIGIGVNMNKVKEIMPNAPVDSLEFIFNPDIISKFASCGFAILDAPNEIIPAALLYKNSDPSNYGLKEIEIAEKALMDIRPHIKYFHSLKLMDDLANGDLCVVFAYSGDILQAAARARENKSNIDIKYFPPKEGALVWIDAMAILKDAKNTENAYKFINYLLDPLRAAESTNEMGFANANIESYKYLNKNIKENNDIYPPHSVMEKSYIAVPSDQKVERAATRMWAKILTNK